MSRKDKLVKSKSIYTIRKKHQTISVGTIYENDHVTIIQNDGIFDDDMPLFSDSNFKFRIRSGVDGKKRHARYGWVNNSTSQSDVWTLANMPENTFISEETTIVQKPNYSSLRDFAYYGSAVELINATVNDIIMRYPGGISYYREHDAPEVWIGGDKYYLLSNEFNIDFWTPKGVSTEGLENPMRVLGASYMKYEDREGNDIDLTICITGNCLDSIIGKVSFSNFHGNGDNGGNEGERNDGGENVLRGGVNNNTSGTVLTITAYTRDQNNLIIPLSNYVVRFNAYNCKAPTKWRKSATTDANGVASVVLGEGQGWELVQGGDSIQYMTNWNAYLTYHGEVHHGTATHGIPCETSNPVLDLSLNENSTDIVVNLVCKKLIVSAYTVDQNDFRTPIQNEWVNFAAYNDKGCTKYINSAKTNSQGVAYVYLCDGYGWQRVHGEENIEDSTHWIGSMSHNGENHSGTTMGGVNCSGETANDIISQNDYTDVILFDNIPSFEGLNVNVVCENDNSPIAGVQVWIDAFTPGGGIYRINGITNMDGEFYAPNNSSSWYWYGGIHHVYGSVNDATSWTAYCEIDGVLQTQHYDSMSYTSATLTFSCQPTYPYDGVTVYTYLGLPGNCAPIMDSLATVVLSDGSHTQQFTGYTNGNGEFYVDFDDCTLQNQVTSWSCCAEYLDMQVSGVTKQITNGNSSNYQNLYFIQEEPHTGTMLIVTAYTSTNGNVLTPIEGGIVTFYVVSNKGGVCSKTAITNSNGVAYVYLSDARWDCSGPNILSDAACWYATMPYNGDVYSGSTVLTCQCGPTSIQNANPIDTNREDTIVVDVETTWCGLSAHTVFSNGEPAPNIPLSISGYTGDETNDVFWIGGRTNSDGWFFVEDNPILWRKISGNGNKTVYDINYFSGCAFYNSNYEYTGISTKVCSLEFVLDKKPENYEIYCDTEYECGDGVIWYDIYLDGEGNKKLVVEEWYPIDPNNLVIIRPKKEYRDEFWNSLDDFERVLLDRESVPIYKARLETPYLLDNRYYYNLKTYIWPTVDGETPDLTTGRFQGYLNSLISLAEYHDEFDSDNLWRMMTHESIKNLDWTFMRQKDTDFEDEGLDSTRMRGILSVWGRHFDDLKRFTDNIKASNTITYDEKNNLPDYFLTDSVEVGGFDAKCVTAFSALTSGDVYPEMRNVGTYSRETSGVSMSKVNSDFMRRLAINEVYIQSMKGTRRGLQAILGLFGYTENKNSGFTTTAGEYDIHEYISIAHEFPSYSNASRLRSLIDYVNYDNNENFMEGYPVAVVSPNGNASDENDYYLIPWFNQNEKYKYPFYFQQKGGWGKMLKKTINEPITQASSITENYGISIYKETEPYMKFVRDIEELKMIPNNVVFENMVCYVTDISTMYGEYEEEPIYPQGEGYGEGCFSDCPESTNVGGNDSRGIDPGNGNNVQVEHFTDYSHYFVLENVALSNYVGFVNNDLYYCFGWRNIHLSEFEGTEPTTDDGLRVLYLESIIENAKDNNPHIGKGNYDEGESYIERMNYVFGEDIKNRSFDFLKDGDEEDMRDYEDALHMGFSISGMVEDNKKCYFFSDTPSSIEMRANINQQTEPQVGPNTWDEDIYTLIPVGEEDEDENYYKGYENFVNPESGETTDEAAANSVVNVKNVIINFGTNGNEYLKKYIETVVMPYLEHMIPSTTILKYRFDNTSANIGIGNVTVENLSVGRIVADGVTTDEGSVYLSENNEGII